MDHPVLDIVDQPRTFVSDEVIAASAHVERCVHPMRKVSTQPLLVPDQPWEAEQVAPVSVVFDQALGRWRMWYTSIGASLTGVLPGGVTWPLHLAESADGLTWDKPALGACAVEGHPANNLCVWEDGTPVAGACAVFDEPDDPDPSRRYKMMYYLPNYHLGYSADGVHWRPARREPVWPNGSGDGLEETHFFMRDPVTNRYRGYMRVWKRHQTIRTTSLGESDDLLTWTGPKIIWRAGPEFGVGAQIYGMTVYYDAGLYWGLPWMFYGDEPLDRALQQNIRFKLGYSHDGATWHALAPEQDALPMGEPGAFDTAMTFTVCPVVRCGDRLRLYYAGTSRRHDDPGAAAFGIGLAEIRPGGFVAMRAGDVEGKLLTHRVLIRGDHLLINARTEADGHIAVELLDDRGQYLKGLTFAEADAFTGDSTSHVLTWSGRRDLRALRGQNVMLRFRMVRAELFTFAVGGEPEQFSLPLGPPPVRVGHCLTPPIIDGRLDDQCWQDFDRSGVAGDFVQFAQNVPATVKTRATLTRDDEHLYIAVDCEEPKLSGTPGAEDAAINPSSSVSRDLIEFRFSAPGQGTFFSQLMVSPAGRQSHCFFSVEEGGGEILDHIDWEAKTAAAPGHWYVEMKVPFQALRTAPPAAGEHWQMNIIRHRQGDDERLTSWSCLFKSVHRNDRSGLLVFV